LTALKGTVFADERCVIRDLKGITSSKSTLRLYVEGVHFSVYGCTSMLSTEKNIFIVREIKIKNSMKIVSIFVSFLKKGRELTINI